MNFDGCPPSPLKKGQNKHLFMQKEHSPHNWCLNIVYARLTAGSVSSRNVKLIYAPVNHCVSTRNVKLIYAPVNHCVSNRNMNPIYAQVNLVFPDGT
jgi:hypothetical protein